MKVSCYRSSQDDKPVTIQLLPFDTSSFLL